MTVQTLSGIEEDTPSKLKSMMYPDVADLAEVLVDTGTLGQLLNSCSAFISPVVAVIFPP